MAVAAFTLLSTTPSIDIVNIEQFVTVAITTIMDTLQKSEEKNSKPRKILG